MFDVVHLRTRPLKPCQSAYKIRKSFMYICIDSSQRFVMLYNGSTLFSSKKDSKSFKNKEKKMLYALNYRK
jgi:hypothetical protein